jgi:hypothetical protein
MTPQVIGEPSMTDNNLQSPGYSTARTVLRVGGPLIALTGVVFIIVGMVSFFAVFGGFQVPKYFWCAFVGMPLFMLGLIMCKFGYIGAVYRYMANETAPVTKDVVNYLGEGAKPGIKAMAEAATEGILEARNEQEKRDKM